MYRHHHLATGCAGLPVCLLAWCAVLWCWVYGRADAACVSCRVVAACSDHRQRLQRLAYMLLPPSCGSCVFVGWGGLACVAMNCSRCVRTTTHWCMCVHRCQHHHAVLHLATNQHSKVPHVGPLVVAADRASAVAQSSGVCASGSVLLAAQACPWMEFACCLGRMVPHTHSHTSTTPLSDVPLALSMPPLSAAF